jgi:soluble lytic murein transglycosylase-like protein
VKRTVILLQILLICALLLPSEGQADIYSFIDSNGTLHYTNTPSDPRQKYQVVVRSLGVPPRFLRLAARKGPPVDPKIYEEHIRIAANTYNVDPNLIKAVIKAESNFDHQAISPKGAQGLMQLMPGTAADLKVQNPFNPLENILGGTNYLRQMLSRFGGNTSLALAAYNAGPNRVEADRNIPAIPETREYVRTVLSHYRIMSADASSTLGWRTRLH